MKITSRELTDIFQKHVENLFPNKELKPRRGFNHALLLAEALAALLNAPCMRTLDTSQTADQRALGRAERLENLTGSFSAEHATCAGKRFVLVDDVHTTGATLCAATDALIASGAREVRVLTFARVL